MEVVETLNSTDTEQRSGLFAHWQPEYGARGIATFPVHDKRPAVRGYLRLGLGASAQLALKFGSSPTFGFACRPSRITVLDVDSPDESLLADALKEFGQTPIVVRSGSGNYQAWYRNSGERRRIRPDPQLPIDILGDGFVVAPPSKGKVRPYELITGTLDDLAALPVMRRRTLSNIDVECEDGIPLVAVGIRNQSLWRQCMTAAPSCSSKAELMTLAARLNETRLVEPLPPSEVSRLVESAWALEQSGNNWFRSGARIVIKHEEIDGLLNCDPDAFILLTLLKRYHWGRPFVVANAMAQRMPGGGWGRLRFAAARKSLETAGEIELLRPASRSNGAAVYKLKDVHF